MVIDFKEIPSAKGGNEGQDEFELFAREFLQAIGFEIMEGPDRGTDGGRDLIILERRHGLVGTSEIRWLVSCKHFAHQSRAVKTSDEINILERMKSFNCDGFIGFYSTLPSSGLTDLLKGTENRIFDHEIIERILLEDGKAYSLIERFFPESWKKIKSKETELSNLLKEYYPLRCDYCGKDLLQNPDEGIFVICERNEEASIRITDAYCACRGLCDKKLVEKYYAKDGSITSWHELSDMIIPRYYLSELLGISDKFQCGIVTCSDEAYTKIRRTYTRLAQLVMRRHKKEEEERMAILDLVP